MASLLFIGAGLFQLPGLRAAKALGHHVIAFDGSADAPGFLEADAHRLVDIRNIDACRKAVRAFKPDGVLTIATEAGVVTAAQIAADLGLRGTPIDAARAATDKRIMREAFAKAGLASPTSHPCQTLEEVERAYRGVGPKAVIKPANGAGSRGVSFVNTLTDLPAAFDAAKAIAGSHPVLVEYFMAGEEVAVEAVLIQGAFHPLCISDKTRTKPPYLLDISITYPSARSKAEQAAILALAEAGARALGLDNTPLHIEIMMTPDGPYLVEIAARGAGFHVFTDIIPWVTGVDTLGLHIAMALGQDIPAFTPLQRGAVLEFPVFKPGRVTRLDGVEAMLAREDVIFGESYIKVGETLRPLTCGGDRAMAFAVKGECLQDALSARDDIVRALKLETV
ncbi:ATP-grasp domain-containing protein [Woodsholea maritima]|uniref:ATP-grasp domain-containing protein n=1 Tax=Woodsholea maritima TaxID=240237 RepID=UPI00039A305F|nr:ATP-grasp domain-containing protein [Woodsholea maritima]